MFDGKSRLCRLCARQVLLATARSMLEAAWPQLPGPCNLAEDPKIRSVGVGRAGYPREKSSGLSMREGSVRGSPHKE